MRYTVTRRQNVFFHRRKMCRHFRVVCDVCPKAAVGITLWWWWCSSIVAKGDGNVVRNEDICGLQNGRRLYLELGEKGILYAKNVSFAKNEPRQEGSRVYTSNSSHAQCSLELVTCPSCVIIVNFQSIALPHHCGDGSVTLDSPCRCDYVWISEPPYEDVSGSPFCGLYAPITYRSSTRTLSITLLYSQSHRHAFTLEYAAERNRLHLRGTELTATGQTAKGLNSTGGGILTSPFFPARYPRDLGLEYVITCPTEAPSCRIRLLFSDFQLATVSIMEFYDWNGQRLDVSSGARFRPPVILSSGPSLLIRFYANGGTGLGYKAFYSFVIGHPLDKSVQPITDCGGYVENLGGAITMMDMVGEGLKTYDCVWLIRPPKNFLHMKTHMYLKVVTFTDMAGNTELIVRQGPTSALLPLEILRHPASQVQPPRHREHVAPVTSGFHVSLRGTFGPASHLAIVYAAFSYMDCFAGSDFLCRNHRCIPSQLNCDGFDHCGDNSDEPATCFRDWEVEPRERKWHANKANYYFPKIDRYPDLKTATLVFVASSLGLIVLISALIVLLYRMGARARQQRELQSRLQTISELLDGARIDEISVSDDPPMYEAPPGYEEVVKLGHDSEIIARKKKSFGRDRLSGSSSGPCCSLEFDRSSIRLTADAASTSRGSCHGTTAPVRKPMGRRSCGPGLPESPPPPYITPPGSMSRNIAALGTAILSSGQREEDEQGGVAAASGTELENKENDEGNDVRFSPSGFSATADGSFLGAYPWNRDGSNSIRSADASCNSQRMISRDASIDTGSGRDDRKDTRGETADGEQRLGETADGPELVDLVENSGKSEAASSATVCSCEGACGCATVHRAVAPFKERPLVSLRSIRRVANEAMEQRPRQLEKNAAREEVEERNGAAKEGKETDEEEDEAAGEQEQDHEEEEEEEDEEARRSGSTIDGPVTARTGKWRNGSGTLTVASTATSTPCDTFRRSMGKLSACSGDACLGRTVTVGSVGSYEKLSNGEFEVARDSRARPRGCRRYSSCGEPESLYEGIRMLDGFLASRGVTVARSRKQSVTVMLFGTPEHVSIPRRPTTGRDERIREIGRVTRYSSDAVLSA